MRENPLTPEEVLSTENPDFIKAFALILALKVVHGKVEGAIEKPRMERPEPFETKLSKDQWVKVFGSIKGFKADKVFLCHPFTEGFEAEILDLETRLSVGNRVLAIK